METAVVKKSESLGDRMILGTASFGRQYGVVNHGRSVDGAKIRELVEFCREHEVFGIDTAPAYGDAEAEVGEAGAAGFAIITKVTCKEALEKNKLLYQVSTSLKKLKIKNCYGLMLHDEDRLQGHEGLKIARNLAELKKTGLVGKIGISSYHPLAADKFLNEFGWDLVQIPFNVLDRRVLEGGFFEKWDRMGILVCLRSIFLQGLLLRNPSLPPASTGNLPLAECAAFRQRCLQKGLSPLEVCLLFVLQNTEKAKIVVGPVCKREMGEILNVCPQQVIPDLRLPAWHPDFDPRNWK